MEEGKEAEEEWGKADITRRKQKRAGGATKGEGGEQAEENDGLKEEAERKA